MEMTDEKIREWLSQPMIQLTETRVSLATQQLHDEIEAYKRSSECWDRCVKAYYAVNPPKKRTWIEKILGL